ncbi:MAG: site-2 protease family protein [Desulfomonile tiedjei]|nr:site-2 protease family protein [Desulfomonile tiedjei]
MKWSFGIGKILGIPVKVHITFLLLLALVFFVGQSIIGIGGFQGVLFVVLVFASVVFHELSHAMVARYYGIEVSDITLLPIGGVARMATPPDQPRQEMIISAAGPVASLVLGFSLWFAADLLGHPVTLSDLSIRGNLLAQLSAVNFVLAIFNLLPAFPMDGGRVLRGFLALYLSPWKATRIAVGVGQAFAIILFFVGLLAGNFFMILIALFVYLGAEAEERQMGIMLSLGHATAQTAMIRDVVTLSQGQTVGEAAERYAHGFQSDFPVTEGHRVLGLVTRDILVETLHKQGPSVPVEEIMVKDFPVAAEQTPLIEILERMQSSEKKVVPVMRGGELVGLVTLEQIGRYNMLCSGFSCEFLESGKTGA